MKFKQPRTLRGFTLIELLVVVAIIGALIAILVPSLGRVRQKAKTTVCATHLRGWGQGMIMYTTDFNGYLPLDGGDGSTDGSVPIGMWDDPYLWFNGVTNYVSGTTQGYAQLQETAISNGDPFKLPHGGTNSMFICPSADQPATGVTDPNKEVIQNGFFMLSGWPPFNAATVHSGVTPFDRPMLLCYGMNSKLRQWSFDSAAAFLNGSLPGDVKKISELTPAYLVPLVAEKRIRPDELLPSDDNATLGLATKELGQSKVTANRFSKRHDAGGNIVFADGHVDLVKYSSIASKALLTKYSVNDYNIPGVIVWNPNKPH